MAFLVSFGHEIGYNPVGRPLAWEPVWEKVMLKGENRQPMFFWRVAPRVFFRCLAVVLLAASAAIGIWHTSRPCLVCVPENSPNTLPEEAGDVLSSPSPTRSSTLPDGVLAKELGEQAVVGPLPHKYEIRVPEPETLAIYRETMKSDPSLPPAEYWYIKPVAP
jgi:hypothetical protein